MISLLWEQNDEVKCRAERMVERECHKERDGNLENIWRVQTSSQLISKCSLSCVLDDIKLG